MKHDLRNSPKDFQFSCSWKTGGVSINQPITAFPCADANGIFRQSKLALLLSRMLDEYLQSIQELYGSEMRFAIDHLLELRTRPISLEKAAASTNEPLSLEQKEKRQKELQQAFDRIFLLSKKIAEKFDRDDEEFQAELVLKEIRELEDGNQ